MPETMTDPRELLLHELGDIYYAENVLVKALPKMAGEAQDGELRAAFEEHADETREQIENLRKAFEQLGAKPQSERCPAIDGIKAEHDEFLDEHELSPELRDMFLTGSGGRAEHYEIAAYSNLITMARSLGEREVADLLDANRRQEKEALKRLEQHGRRLARAGKRANGGADR
jgi:ferritin-like metal-binding protein YciE